jgi:hypothetical protein
MKWKSTFAITIILTLISIGIIFALETNLTVDACSGGCSVANVGTDGGAYDTLDKNEVWVIDYTTQSCDSINSGKVSLDLWDDGTTETLTVDCSTDGSTWDKCGTNTFSPASAETNYNFSLTGVTCANIANLQVRVTSNDGAGPDDFYLDYTYVYLDYEVPADTCTAPGSGNWAIDCSDNCVWDGDLSIPGNISMTGTGTLTLNANMDLTSSKWIIFKEDGCKLVINSGGSIQ